VATYVILFLLFLLQFFFFPVGTSFFEGSKVYAAEIAIVILFLLCLFSKEGIQYKNYPKPCLFSLAGIAFIGLYHVFFDQTKTVLFGNIFRLQGTMLVWFLLAFALISAKVSIERKYIPTLSFAALVVQFICALLFVGVGSDRPVGTIGEPNALAASVLFLWPFVVLVKKKTKWYWLQMILSTLIVLAMIIITGSRSAMIAFGIQVFFLLFVRFLPKRLGVATILALLFLCASYIFPLTSHDVYENRGEIWKSALVAGTTHPVLGVGFGNAEYELHKANLQLHNHLPGYYVDSAHNIFLDWWVQGGVIGLGILVWLLYRTFAQFIVRQNILYITLLVGLLAALSFNPASVVSLIALWWMIGQSFSAPNKKA
jgi:O-antigen ligase